MLKRSTSADLDTRSVMDADRSSDGRDRLRHLRPDRGTSGRGSSTAWTTTVSATEAFSVVPHVACASGQNISGRTSADRPKCRTSPTTPTTVIQGSGCRPPDECVDRSIRPGRNRRANDSLTITAAGCPRVSDSVKSLPRLIGIPIAASTGVISRYCWSAQYRRSRLPRG
jgi:hypothetical protein